MPHDYVNGDINLCDKNELSPVPLEKQSSFASGYAAEALRIILQGTFRSVTFTFCTLSLHYLLRRPDSIY